MFRSHYDAEVATFARLLLGGYFVYSGLDNFMNLFAMAESVAIPGGAIFITLGAALKIFLGLCLALRYHTRYVAFALAVYLIGTTVLFYGPQFWTTFEHYEAIFFRNIAIVGGLLFIYSNSRGAELWQEEWIPEKQKKMIAKAQNKIAPHP